MTESDQPPLPIQVIVSSDSIKSDDPGGVIYSNIGFLNALMEEHLRHDELSPDALRSYYVDYYLAQINNGGFSQFVYNSGWEEEVIRAVKEGLEAMGAVRHLELFKESASILDRIGVDGMERFFASDYFGDNVERDRLNEFDDQFFELCTPENLIEMNAKWLRGLPHLVVMSEEEMQAEVERQAAAFPDREARAAEALEDEPRFTKLIRALCASLDQELLDITAGDPSHEHEGKPVLAWHFITDIGHHYMVEADGRAIMFHGDSHDQVASVEATDEYGEDE